MNILYMNNIMNIGGVTKCILKLSKELQDDNNIFIASHGGELLDEFDKLGIEHFEILNVQNKNPINILKNVTRLLHMVRENNIKIIHSHHRMTTLLAIIVRKYTGVKVVHTQHSDIDNKFKLTRFVLNNVKTVTVSNAINKMLVEKIKLNKKNITTVYNTIELENNNKKIDSKLFELKQQGSFVVAHVSRLVESKGIYDFVEIAQKTVQKNKNIKFVLLGDGPEKEKLEKHVENLNLGNYVYVLGSKDNIIEHLAYVDLLLLCSYTEGLPLAPIEAFSQSIPVVASNIDGLKEEVIDNYNGYLFDIRDTDSFSDKILELFHDSKLIERLKLNAYKTYQDKFIPEKYKNDHIDIYNFLEKERI